MTYYVYILQSRKNDSFYKGSTDNLIRTFLEHNAGKDSSSARYSPWHLVCYTKKSNRSEAVVLEMKLKNLSVQKIIDFIKKYPVVEEGSGPDITSVRQPRVQS